MLLGEEARHGLKPTNLTCWMPVNVFQKPRTGTSQVLERRLQNVSQSVTSCSFCFPANMVLGSYFPHDSSLKLYDCKRHLPTPVFCAFWGGKCSKVKKMLSQILKDMLIQLSSFLEVVTRSRSHHHQQHRVTVLDT